VSKIAGGGVESPNIGSSSKRGGSSKTREKIDQKRLSRALRVRRGDEAEGSPRIHSTTISKTNPNLRKKGGEVKKGEGTSLSKKDRGWGELSGGLHS